MNEQWEYTVIALAGYRYQEALNSLGKEGWELVAVAPGSKEQFPTAYLKRRLIPER